MKLRNLLCNRLLNLFPFTVVNYGSNSICKFCNGRWIKGRNNKIELGDNTSLYKCKFIVKGNNNTIVIGRNCVFNTTTFWISGDNNQIVIGDNTTIGHNCEFATLEGTSIKVGEDCMFSHDVRLRTSDSHSIINTQGLRLNKAKDICIGNHCWVGMQVLVLKGVQIQNNSVLAARSLVSKPFMEGGVIIAGTPATVIKNDINWDRKRI